MSSRDAILLDQNDNVATSLRRIVPGETVVVAAASGDRHVIAAESIPIFHKISMTALSKGAKVVKHGDVIGILSADADEGALVHVHNLRSLRAQRKP